ncbi:Cytochrome P450 9e2 [Atta colombica]|uniref:Cytochrome P450 9e2 n=1 Tax=Atta colombica TaxID=520822 RepID=A0A195BN52_9HYME|nr:Cytochrome P450 9e2 [Atta colombica]
MIVVLVSLILGALIAFYFYLTRNYKYWQKREVPYVDGALPRFDNMLSVICMKTHIADFYCKIYKDNKGHNMVGIYDFTSPALMIIKPALVKMILQTYFSSFVENAFSSMRLKILLESIKKVCATMENYLSNKETEFELKSLFSKYSAQVVAVASFDIDGYCFDDDKKDVSFRKLGQAIFLKLDLIPKHVDNFFRTLVAELMEQKRKDGILRNDFLHLMAELERTEGDKFDNEMLTGQAMSFVLNGYETSSSVMSFVGFYLTHYSKIQEKLHEEMVSVLNKYDSEITYEGLREITYMDQIINETMRLVSAVLLMKRRCTQEFELKGSNGVVCRVTPGMKILISVQAVHKDPQYWENPEEYDPERFDSDRKHNIDRFFLPFFVIVRKYKLELSPKMQMPLKLIPGIILPTPKGLWAYFRQP